ncbi:heavy-metal-associated domain-containing protein [Streptomyces sp. V1I1]|uniref:heavy-metal-associated domain-containing protein n=1 Tax=Streptomyces sp. V1I1 TaxID=3042272 RepID=UPI00278AE561|nr:cation transporter [Streptomyces sp. V1I1]MDQ0939316.1 copper chaperone [Streptomyces sp. V1I1]
MKLFKRKKDTDTGKQLVLHIEGMHCNSCGLLIDDELEDIPGVRSSSTDVKAGRTTVRLEEGADVATAALVAAVQQAGDYTARPAD